MEELEEKPVVQQERKGKVGARVIDQFGKEEKKRRALDLGLSDFVLPPITRRTVATYRILGVDRIDPSSGQLADPKSVVLPGTYMFYDPGEQDLTKRNKLQHYYARPEIVIDPVSKKQVLDNQIVGQIEFIYGVKKVNVETDYRLYCFLELHPLNRTNRFRPNSVPPKFERIDLISSRSLASEQAMRDMAHEAEGEVMRMTDKDLIIGYATSNGISTMENGSMRDIASIKMDLRRFAAKDPIEFYKHGNNFTAAVRLTVLDAIGWGLIEYVPDKRSYFIEATKESLKSMHTVAVGEDPTESFVKFLSQKDNPEAAALYQAIYNMVNYWK